MERVERGENDVAQEQEAAQYPGWKAMPYVIGNETFEKLGTMGTMTNQQVYLKTVFHMKSIAANTMLNNAAGTAAMAPLLGAFLSDSYIGRYLTLAFASLASLLGMVLLTLTAAITKLHPPACNQDNQQGCQGPTQLQMFVLISCYFLLIIGAGGIRPCNLAFGADQFDQRSESGSMGINSFFNWYYGTFTCAVMISSTVIVYVQSSISWAIGLGIPAALMLLSCIAFFIGTKLYMIVKPQGSPLIGFVQVPVAAFKKRHLKTSELLEKELFDLPYRSSLVSTKLPHSNQFKFLDKAAIITSEDQIKSNGEAADPWRLCTLQQVEIVKCVIRMIPIWFSCVLFYIPQSQHNYYTTNQALQMDCHLGHMVIPAGSFVVFNMLTLTLWIPIYDRLIVPQLRKITKHENGISVLQRIGVGTAISILGMVVSALVEHRRRYIALHKPSSLGTAPNGGTISSMSGLWLLPQLILFGLCEAFNMIGQTQFFYHQFPENMKSVGMAVFCLAQAVSNYGSSVLVTTVHKVTGRNGSRNWLAEDLNEGRLDLFYLAVAGLAMFNLVYFIICAKYYRSNGTANGAKPEVNSDVEEKKTVPF